MPESAAQTSRAQDYSSVLAKLASALSNEPSTKALTTSVQRLRENSDHFDWVGIYLVHENDLVLEAFAGMKKQSTLGYR